MTFTDSDLVVVTGANGHVAQHVISQLLSSHAPVRIRGTVRSSIVVQKLYAAFEPFISSGRLEIAIVPDLTVDGAFDDALQGATYVAHIASPLNMSPENVENDLLIPAIKGNICILESIMKQTGIKAAVITSSFVAAFDARHGFREGYTYSSADWNPISYDGGRRPKALHESISGNVATLDNLHGFAKACREGSMGFLQETSTYVGSKYTITILHWRPICSTIDKRC